MRGVSPTAVFLIIQTIIMRLDKMSSGAEAHKLFQSLASQ